MTGSEYSCLLDAKRLDDIHLGMLQPADLFHERALRACVEARWLREEPFAEPWNRVYFLTTRGLRALQREARRRALRIARRNCRP